MNKKDIALILMALIILAGVGYYGYNYNINQCNLKVYNSSLNAYNTGTTDVILKINKEGNVPVIQNNSVNWISINQICGQK